MLLKPVHNANKIDKLYQKLNMGMKIQVDCNNVNKNLSIKQKKEI